MKIRFVMGRQLRLAGRVAGVVSVCVLAAGLAAAQQVQARVQPRIQAEINTSQASVLKGSLNPLAQSRFDTGRMPAGTQLHSMSIFFRRSPEQEADLQALLKAQQNPSSPLFHKWLTPEEFGARFGLAESDIAKVESWLESEGFKIESVNRARTGIHFSGTVGQVERAFSTQMHFYNVNGQKRFAPATAVSIPSALSGVVTGVGNLHDFHPRPMHIRPMRSKVRARSQYTINAGGDQYVFFAPGDIRVAYDMKSLISAGNDGTGQTITILGQSAIDSAAITNFQDAAGITVKAPTLTLVPGTGTSTLNPGCDNGGDYNCGGDEGESELDIEWANAAAPGATINFVYTGGTLQNGSAVYGVFDSYQYAVDNAIGNILNLSYGACETELQQSDFDTLEEIGAEAVAQGQTVVAASGDQGATACGGYTDLTTAQQTALTVNYPASSVYVTAVGGTEITADNAQVGTYWGSADTNDITLTSALSYIPEVAWNDDVLTIDGTTYKQLSASGGGASVFAARPSWQTGVTGIPSGTKRLVPDVALYSSPNYPSYLFCTSDQYDWDVPDGQSGSCGDNEFYWSGSEYIFFTAAGGTSFASPIFAGMLAIVNQAKGYTSGQGLANPELYKLASNSTTYASAFHDVTEGNNNCTAGSTYCGSQTGGFSAGTGYDEVTGLGSVDLANLVTAYASGSATLVDTTTSIAASSTTPAVGTADSFTVTVKPASGSTAPTGTVAVTVDGTAISGSPFTLTASGSNATATFSYTFTSAGAHTVSVSYSGDSDFNTSTDSTTITVSGGSEVVATTTTVAASDTTPTVGTSDSFTVTVKPASGSTAPTGKVSVTVDGTAIDGSPLTLTASGSSATATFTYTFSAAGSHTIAATYTGDANFSTSTGSTTVTAESASAGTFAMAFTPATLTVSQGSSGTETLSVTPSDGYKGTIGFSYTTSDDTALANLCLYADTGFDSNGDLTISGTSAVTGQIDVETNGSCTSSSARAASQKHRGTPIPHLRKLQKTAKLSSQGSLAGGLALAGLLLAGFFGKTSRKLRALACVLILSGVGMALVACGGSSSTGGGDDDGGSSSNSVPKGTYTITFTGKDTTTSSITASKSFTLTVD